MKRWRKVMERGGESTACTTRALYANHETVKKRVCVCVEVVRQSGTVSSCCYETAGLTRGGESERAMAGGERGRFCRICCTLFKPLGTIFLRGQLWVSTQRLPLSTMTLCVYRDGWDKQPHLPQNCDTNMSLIFLCVTVTFSLLLYSNLLVYDMNNVSLHCSTMTQNSVTLSKTNINIELSHGKHCMLNVWY